MFRGFVRSRRARAIALFAVLALLWQAAAALVPVQRAAGSDNPICSAHLDSANLPAPAPDDSKSKTLCALCAFYCGGGHAAGLIPPAFLRVAAADQLLFRLAVADSVARPVSQPFSSFLSRAPPVFAA
jgi:hypothetical protein